MTESLWLGPLRRPLRLLTTALGAATLALLLWMIAGHALSDAPIGMYEMLRPEGRPLVRLMLWSVTALLLGCALLLSDRIGGIEVRPTGPMDLLSLVCSRLAMIGVITVVLVMFYEVVSRYVFEKPTLWANELSLWIAGFVFLLAGLYAMQQRSHIRIYVVYDLLPRWAQKAGDILSVLMIWAFAAAVVWGGYTESAQKLARMETFGTAWDPPIPATIKPAILIIGVLVAIQALSNLIADWNKPPEHHSPADEIDEEEIASIRRAVERADG